MSRAVLDPDRCIACVTCLAHCPVSAANADYPGPRFMGPAFERFRLSGLEEDPALSYCSNCKNCDIACPHDVPISALIMRARAAAARKKRPSPRDFMLAHGTRFAALTRILPAAFINACMLNPLTRRLLDVFGIARAAPLPPFARHDLTTLLRRGATRPGGNSRKPAPTERRAVFFPGCFLRVYEPETALDILRLMEKAGYTVEVPGDFVCCGLPLIANAFQEDARTCARRNFRLLDRYAREDVLVVTGCPSCRLMLTGEIAEYFPELLAENAGAGSDGSALSPASAARAGKDGPFLLPRIQDAQRVLLESAERGELALPENLPPRSVIYHAPCHLRALGGADAGPALLRLLPNYAVFYADAGCCGLSGSYGFKKEKYATGMETGAALFRALRESPAELSASECGICRLQMRHGSGKPALHPASILRRALDMPDSVR
jgi:glycerol-3-phosphate dehydrogenase subunit C